MIRIVYNFYEQHFDENSIRISQKPHNVFTLSDTNKITLKKLPVVTNERNTPGNAVEGATGQPPSVVRLNGSVSRKIQGDPTPTNEGVDMPSLMKWLFVSKPDGQVKVEYQEITGGKPEDWDTNYMNYYTDEDGDGNYEKVEQVTSAPEWDDNKTYYRKEEIPITPTPSPTTEWEAILGSDIPDEVWNEKYSEYYTRSGEPGNYVYSPVSMVIPTKDNAGTYYKPKASSDSDSGGEEES